MTFSLVTPAIVLLVFSNAVLALPQQSHEGAITIHAGASRVVPLTNPNEWFDQPNYPYRLCRNPSTQLTGWEEGVCEEPPAGIVEFRLFIAANGRVVGCLIIHSSEDERLDYETCRISRQRARFRLAALDGATNEVAIFDSSVDWSDPRFHRHHN